MAETNGIDRAAFLEFVERHEAIDEELLEAQETTRSIRRRRKDLRKTIAAEGINIDAFDRALADAERSGEEREAEDRRYREYMIFLQKPVGYQTAMELVPVEPSVADLKRVDREGFTAGKAGDRADRNSYSPGTEAFARWHTAWTRGQAELVTEEIQPTDAPKRRGRPRKVQPDSEPPMTEAEIEANMPPLIRVEDMPPLGAAE